MRVEFITPALEEFFGAIEFYRDQAPGLGEAFVGDVERSIALFTEFPSLGSPAPPATRRVRLSRFPYSLVYQVADYVIRVIAVEHQNRLPGFWRGRV